MWRGDKLCFQNVRGQNYIRCINFTKVQGVRAHLGGGGRFRPIKCSPVYFCFLDWWALVSVFQEFIDKYQSTLEQAAACGRVILPKPPSPPSLHLTPSHSPSPPASKSTVNTRIIPLPASSSSSLLPQSSTKPCVTMNVSSGQRGAHNVVKNQLSTPVLPTLSPFISQQFHSALFSAVEGAVSQEVYIQGQPS